MLASMPREMVALASNRNPIVLLLPSSRRHSATPRDVLHFSIPSTSPPHAHNPTQPNARSYPSDDTKRQVDAYKAALDSLSPGDVTTVFTPDDTHYEITKYAIQKKIHVLVTKYYWLRFDSPLLPPPPLPPLFCLWFLARCDPPMHRRARSYWHHAHLFFFFFRRGTMPIFFSFFFGMPPDQPATARPDSISARKRRRERERYGEDDFIPICVGVGERTWRVAGLIPDQRGSSYLAHV